MKIIAKTKEEFSEIEKSFEDFDEDVLAQIATAEMSIVKIPVFVYSEFRAAKYREYIYPTYDIISQA